MKYSSVIILYNPKSTRDSKSNALEFKKSLAEKGINKVILRATEYAGHAEKLAYYYAKKTSNPLIISSSGDGGYNEVINGALSAQLEGAKPTTCVLPSGNANDHYHQLHHGSTINHITEGNRRHIDVLYIKVASDSGTWRRYAHSYIGFGVTPEIGRELTQAQLNKANEVIISLKSFLKSKPFTIIEQVKTNEYQSIVISNIAKMSKVLGLAKDSTVNDGLFEIFALPPGKAFMLGVIVKSATVGLRYTKQTDKYVFKTVNKQPVQLDGEVFDIPANALVTVGIEQRNLACIV